MVGRVGFGGFVILWLKPNPTRYKKNFVTQPNPPSLKNQPNPAGWVGLGRVWQVGGFFAHPYPIVSNQRDKCKIPILTQCALMETICYMHAHDIALL